MCRTIWGLDTVFNGRLIWHPLETILGAWLYSIRKGNVDAAPEDRGKYQLELGSGLNFEHSSPQLHCLVVVIHPREFNVDHIVQSVPLFIFNFFKLIILVVVVCTSNRYV
jgi:hypothetical protein